MTHRFVRLSLSLASLGAAVALAGCGALQPGTDIGYGAPSAAATLSGSAHGGAQVITGADVRLYTSGTSGLPATQGQGTFSYGVNSTWRAEATTTSTGAFAFTKTATNSDTINRTTPTWSCPTAGDPLVYIVATGGNPTGQRFGDADQRCDQVDGSPRTLLTGRRQHTRLPERSYDGRLRSLRCSSSSIRTSLQARSPIRRSADRDPFNPSRRPMTPRKRSTT